MRCYTKRSSGIDIEVLSVLCLIAGIMFLVAVYVRVLLYSFAMTGFAMTGFIAYTRVYFKIIVTKGEKEVCLGIGRFQFSAKSSATGSP
jgi:hypothetical protein